MQKTVLGIDIGGSSVKAGVFTLAGDFLWDGRVFVNRHFHNEDFQKALFELFSSIPTQFTITKVGVGSPGPIDTELGTIQGANNLESLQNFRIVSLVQNHFHCPVAFDNDANSASLGEFLFGNGKGSESLLILTLGTGLGGGWVYRGKLFSGWKGNGIEIGHTTAVINGARCGCGQKGCLESYFSTRGFLAQYKERTGVSLLDAKTFFDLVRKKDPNAESILSFGIECLAQGCRTAVNLLNCDRIVLVGGMVEASDLFLSTLQARVKELVFPNLGERLEIKIGTGLSGIYGAVGLALSIEGT